MTKGKKNHKKWGKKEKNVFLEELVQFSFVLFFSFTNSGLVVV